MDREWALSEPIGHGLPVDRQLRQESLGARVPEPAEQAGKSSDFRSKTISPSRSPLTGRQRNPHVAEGRVGGFIQPENERVWSLRALNRGETWEPGLARRDAPIPAADPVDDEAAVFLAACSHAK